MWYRCMMKWYTCEYNLILHIGLIVIYLTLNFTPTKINLFGTSNFSLLFYVYRKPVLPTVVTVLSREAVRTHTTVGPHVIDTHSIVRTRLSYTLVYVWKSSELLSFLVLSYSHLQDILFFTSSKIIMFHIDFSKNFN